MTGKVRVPPAGEQPAAGSVHVDAGRPHAAGGPAAGPRGPDAVQAQLDERTADLQRITAEFSNYRRRVERDRQLVAALAKAQVAGELLPVLDDIERAAQHGDLSGAFKAVADKLVAGLQAHGLEPFGAIGDGFDPDVHQAVQHSTAPDVDKPTVTAVLRRGYRFGERVLRPAMVAVTDAEPADAQSADAQSAQAQSAQAQPAGTEPWGNAEPLGNAEPGGGYAPLGSEPLGGAEQRQES